MREYYRGIGYDVQNIGSEKWEWSIYPPDSVKGLTTQRGEVVGVRATAITAAKRAIEAQDVLLN